MRIRSTVHILQSAGILMTVASRQLLCILYFVNGIMFDRYEMIGKLKKVSEWDLIVIGGGSTGLGIAVDAATRGFKTLLLEQSDFAKGTSSRSTKLIHGGVRYLEQGNIQLVFAALRERGLLLKNAPHLVKKQSFIIPCYSLWERIKYAT
ncbi:MAG: FAD-dependent oxidoreductase, partial [Flavisolibacter sp.]